MDDIPSAEPSGTDSEEGDMTHKLMNEFLGHHDDEGDDIVDHEGPRDDSKENDHDGEDDAKEDDDQEFESIMSELKDVYGEITENVEDLMKIVDDDDDDDQKDFQKDEESKETEDSDNNNYNNDDESSEHGSEDHENRDDHDFHDSEDDHELFGQDYHDFGMFDREHLTPEAQENHVGQTSWLNYIFGEDENHDFHRGHKGSFKSQAGHLGVSGEIRDIMQANMAAAKAVAYGELGIES